MRRARTALLSLPGVHEVEVSFDEQLAAVDYDPDRASLDVMIAALEGAGFQAWDTAAETRAGPAGEGGAP